MGSFFEKSPSNNNLIPCWHCAFRVLKTKIVLQKCKFKQGINLILVMCKYVSTLFVKTKWYPIYYYFRSCQMLCNEWLVNIRNSASTKLTMLGAMPTYAYAYSIFKVNRNCYKTSTTFKISEVQITTS